MDTRTKFQALQTAWRVTSKARDQYRCDLQCKYGSHAYAKTTERKRLDQLDRAEKRASDRFVVFLQKVSPRDWQSGMPCSWLRDSLTFEDAQTRGALSTVPPPAWGYCERANIAFARALPEGK